MWLVLYIRHSHEALTLSSMTSKVLLWSTSNVPLSPFLNYKARKRRRKENAGKKAGTAQGNIDKTTEKESKQT